MTDIPPDRCDLCRHLKWLHHGEKGDGYCTALGCVCTEAGLPPQPPDIVDRANAALQNTTPGPWETKVHAMPGATIEEWFVREIVQPSDGFHDFNVLKVRGARHAGKSCCWPPTDADAEFIAASRTLIPELIAEVVRLRRLI